MKNAPDPSKSCMGSKKCHIRMRQQYLQAIETISKYKWTNALGFELQSAPNLHRDKKNTCFELQSAPNLHRDKKNKSFELQSAPNLHRDKKNKKNKNFRGIVAPSQVDCEVFVFFVPVQVWCTLKFKTFVFLSLRRFGALWSSKLVFFLSLWRFGRLWSPTPCLKPAQGQKISKFWTSKCTKPAQGQKKQKFWTSKCTKPAQGQKKQKNKNFRGIVAPS